MKKTLSILLVLMLTISLFAGCGNKDEDTTPAATTDEKQSTGDTDKEEPAAEEPAAEEPAAEEPVVEEPALPKSIKVSSGLWSKPEEQQFIREEILPMFFEQTGIEVELDIVEGSTLDKSFEAQKASGEWTSDVVLTHSGSMPKYIELGYVQPMNDILDGLDITFMEAFNASTSKDGDVFYFPISADVYLLLANKEALPFMPEGASMDTLTWEQYSEWAINMANEVGPKVTFPALPVAAILYQMGGISLSYGGSFPEINTPGMVDAWGVVGNMIKEGAILETSFNYNSPVDQMKSEEAWLTFYHMVPVGNVYSSAPAKYEVAPAPAGPNGNGSIAGAWGVGIAAGTENREAAKMFVEFLTDKAVLYEVASGTGGFIPPVVEVVDELGNDPTDIIMKKGLDTLNNGVVSGVPGSNYTDWGAAKSVFDAVFTELWDNNGEVTQEFLDERQADLEDLLVN